MTKYLINCSLKFGNISVYKINTYFISDNFIHFADFSVSDDITKIIFVNKDFFIFKEQYFKDCPLIMDETNIQHYYNNYIKNRKSNKESFSELCDFFILGMIADEDHLFYIKLKYPEIFEHITIEEIKSDQ